ncbi:MAG: amidohydrolase family protein [Gemmatimonadota bacterium]
MTIDVNVFLGSYPFRRVPGTSSEAVLRGMDRIGVETAWVSHLPGLFWKDPAEGNSWLFNEAQRVPRFRPVPAVQPELAHWEDVVAEAASHNAPAVRCDPQFSGLNPAGAPMRQLLAVAAELDMPVLMAVRLEDLRQRHPNDVAGDLQAATVRALVRSHPRVRLIITHADRGFIDEVYFGSTPEEQARIWWDICWIWGPPDDHLATLVKTIGADRFLFGSGMPLRIPENSVAKLDLSGFSADERRAIEEGTAAKVGARA